MPWRLEEPAPGLQQGRRILVIPGDLRSWEPGTPVENERRHPMNKRQQQAFRQQLGALAARLQPETRAISEQSFRASGGQGTTELSNAPMHLGDQGTEEYLHGLNTALLENEGYLLAEVRGAIARLDDGTFGRCERCGRSIGRERLKTLPYVRLCIRCAEEGEDAPLVSLDAGRPRSPADTLADEEEMEIKRRDEKTALTDMISDEPSEAEADEAPPEISDAPRSDNHAVGTPGGGAAAGGLGGATKGDGAPDLHDLEEAMGSGHFDATEGKKESRRTPIANRSGSALRGTPATER